MGVQRKFEAVNMFFKSYSTYLEN